MKSIGVRVGAGAVTVLLGAFAAVQAQRDRQETGSESWSAATPPALEEPLTPIGDTENGSWLTDPDAIEGDSPATPESAIQLVQHTEPVLPEGETESGEATASQSISLPAMRAGTGEPAATAQQESGPSAALVPDWAMPSPGEDAPAADAAPSMSLPAMAGAAAGAAVAGAADELPDVQFANPPSMGFPGAAGDASETVNATLPQDQPVATTEPASTTEPGSPFAGETQAMPNALRGGPSNGNVLRESPSAADAGDAAFGAGLTAGAAALGAMAGAAVAESSDSDTPSLPAGGFGGNQFAGDASDGPSAGLGQPEQGFPNPAISQTQDPNLPAQGFDAQGFDTQGQAGQSPFMAGQQAPESGLSREATAPADAAAQNPASGFPSPGFADPRSADPGFSAPGVAAPGFSAPNLAGAGAAGAATGAAAATQNPYAGQPDARVASLPNRGGSLGPGYAPTEFDDPASAMPLNPNQTNASPGDRRLEGVQAPSIVIQKRAPSEVKVGKPASFVISVQNVGSVEALDVKVHDQIPLGMKLIDASPAPMMQGDRLLWQLGSMPAGDERTVTMQLVPQQEGELGSVARVSFEAAASVRTMSTRPELKIVQRTPQEKILIGGQLEIDLEVSNPGTGEATGVVLQEDVPEGLEHPKGRKLDNLIGTLAPGEVRRQVLRLRAVSPGVIENTIRLVGDDGLTAEQTVAVEVVAPELKVALSGPSKRFLERQATYELEVANVGTAAATNIEIAVQLDRGFTFVSTENEGQYDASRHAVFWSLAQLPEGGSGKVPLTLLPVEEGQQAINVDARADLGVVAKSERTIAVDSFAELSFQISNPGGPIEIGSETVYEVRVQNSGSRNDTNVQVQLQLPQGLELVSTDGDANTNGRGLVAFKPQGELASGGDITYRLRVRGVAPGTHLVKAIVTSDQSTVPVTKEESTRVYSDR